jgi:hypothetical protein
MMSSEKPSAPKPSAEHIELAREWAVSRAEPSFRGTREQPIAIVMLHLLDRVARLEARGRRMVPIVRLVQKRDCCDGSDARRRPECQEALDALAAHDRERASQKDRS